MKRALLLISASIVLTACAFTPDPVNGGHVQHEKTDMLRMPYGISDVAVVCDGTTAVYVSQKGGVATVTGSPRCAR